MKKLFCEGCGLFVAKIKVGSSIRKGAVILCSKCEIKRIASDIAKANKPKDPLGSMMNDLFGRR